MAPHIQLIQLVVAYTLAGAFVFTVFVTCLSLVGWIKFANSKQQQKLFATLIVEVVAVSIGFFGGLLKFDPKQVQQNIEQVKLDEQVELLQKIYTSISGLKAETRDKNTAKQLEIFADRISAIATHAREAEFKMSDFSRSDFMKSQFTEARFDASSFLRCSFRNAELTDALFEGASFKGSRFDEADFRGADLSKVRFDGSTLFPKNK